MAVNTTKMAARGGHSSSTSTSPAGGGTIPGTSRKKSHGQLSDDEILGLVTTVSRPEMPAATSDAWDASTDNADGSGAGAPGDATAQSGSDAPGDSNGDAANGAAAGSDSDEMMNPEVAKALEANPQLRQTLADAQAYRAVFASPGAAQDAKNQLDELDGMFFSGKPGDHAALAARIHELSPEAFQNFVRAVQAHAAKVNVSGPQPAGARSVAGTENAGSPAKAQQLKLFPPQESDSGNASGDTGESGWQIRQQSSQLSSGATTGAAQHSVAQAVPVAPVQSAATAANDPRHAAQIAFFHDTNAAAVEKILGTIQTQVNQLLPDSVPTGTRNRIIGEVYRELDSTLRANRQLGKQLREAFNAGAGDAAHQRAIVTLVAGRAKQALPSVAKRVIGEWTQHIVAANHERLSRHEAASKRVDIAGAGASDGVNRKPLSARDLNYRKLSDADILNL